MVDTLCWVAIIAERLGDGSLYIWSGTYRSWAEAVLATSEALAKVVSHIRR